MQVKAINTLLFDLDNTLIDQRHALLTWLANYESVISLPEGLRLFEANQDMRSVIRYLSGLLGTPPKTLFANYQAHLMQVIRPEDDVQELLSELQVDFTLGLVSNGRYGTQIQKIKQAGLEKFFKVTCISGQLGVRKPEAGIFLHALQHLKREATQCLFIGDDLLKDIEGAHRVGMKTCWLSSNELPDAFPLRPTYQINALSKLRKLL